jgi:hypothetical protein
MAFAPEAGRLLFAIPGEAGIATSLSGTSCGILAPPRLVRGEASVDALFHSAKKNYSYIMSGTCSHPANSKKIL